MTTQPESDDLAALRQAAFRAHRNGEETALRAYASYLARAPEDAQMWSNLGALHRAKGRHVSALRAHERAQKFAADDISLRNNYANILSDIGRYDDSIAARRWILSQNPDDANQKAMIGRCLRGAGDYRAAIAHLRSAIADHPDDAELQLQLAFAQLGAGDFTAAFETYRIRWQTDEMKPRSMHIPEWDGDPLDGKTILVMPEQGFGDAILFARFVPALKAKGAKVLFLAEKPVAPLFAHLAGADAVAVSFPKSIEVDYWMNSMDMARVYFAGNDDVPAPASIHIPEESRARAKHIVAPHQRAFRVGVVWTGSATYKGNSFRSFSHTDLLPLVDIPGAQLFSLYKGPELQKFHADGSDAFMIDAGSSEQHFGDCAAMMQEMDLVISSDTATLHLAGSLGVPTWGVLHWDPFWVWRHVGETTDWYPGMRLFRQTVPLQWSDVIADVARALRRRVEGK